MAGLTVLGAEKNAWTSPYPDMRNFTLPVPPDHRQYSPDDLVVNEVRIKNQANFNPVLGTREKLLEEGRKRLRSNGFFNMLQYFNAWKPGKPADMHYGSTFQTLTDAAYLYWLTGNRDIGSYVHDYALHAATLGDWFWLGQTILGKNWEKSRHASLITAYIGRTYVAILTYAGDVFTPEEKILIENAVRKNCHDSSVRFCQAHRNGNFNAVVVIAGGLLVTAKYFNDRAALDLALECLDHFVNNSVEKDGSYGEGFHYFCYAISSLYPSWQQMDRNDRNRVFGKSNLRYSPTWMVYHYYFRKPYSDQKDFYKAVFGDSNFNESKPDKMLYMLSDLYHNALTDYLNGNGAMPSELIQLPVVKCFDNGENFIRSGWGPDALVMNIQIQHPVKAQIHRRKESGSFTLGINGFPLIMHAGNTNLYRRPVHAYALKTTSANTVAIDGGDQLEAAVQNCRVTACYRDKELEVLSFDLRSAYSQPASVLIRSIIFLKKPQVYIVIDRIRFAGGKHQIEAFLHLNNIRSDSVLEKKGDLAFIYRNPQAEMHLYCGGDIPLEMKVDKGFVVSDLYSNWDEAKQVAEMNRGNVFKLRYGSNGKIAAATIFAVLVPFLPGQSKSCPPSWQDNTMTVDGVKVTIADTSLKIEYSGKSINIPTGGTRP